MTRSGFAASHQVAVKVAPPTNAGLELPVVGGRVDYEGGDAATRARVSLTIEDPEYIPDDPQDILAPFGQELQVWRGAYGEELHSLGVFIITDVDADDDGAGGTTVSLNGLDRSRAVIDAAFETAGNAGNGANYIDEMARILSGGYGVNMVDWPSMAATMPRLIYTEGEDRWAFLQNCAAAIGCELYFDRDGNSRLEQIPDPANVDHGLHLHEGVDGVLVSVNKSWTREDSKNKVRVTGENAGEGAPVYGEAFDDDPNSPTRYGGDFGKVPFFESFEYLTTAGQCETAALGILRQRKGIGQTINFGAITDPTLDVGDSVHVKRDRLSLDESHVVDTLSIPLRHDEPMTGTSRIARITG